MTVASIYQTLHTRLHDTVPDVELRYKAEIAYEILRLKKEQNAVILGHNYMEPALFHSIPDHTGDSLELSRIAATTQADTIVFCGVRFMAETAKILAPSKTVLLPSRKGGCSLADGITAEDVRMLKQRFPGAPVVTYVNTSADVKAESDICCTSSNVVDIIRSLEAPTVLCLPDEYLARNAARESGRSFSLAGRDGSVDNPRAGVIGWPVRCEVHERFTAGDVADIRRQFPDASVLAHPECSPDVVAAADFAGSTSAMIRYVRLSSARRLMLLTECSMADNIVAEHPDKALIRMCSYRCPHMNEITLEETLASLRTGTQRIEVDEQVRQRARLALDRMLTTAQRHPTPTMD